MGAKTVLLTESMSLKENEKLSSISKEFHTRKHIVYIAEDKLHEFVILSQRLSGLATQINEIVGDKPDQVSVPGLYKIVSSPCENKLIKHRWKIYPLYLTDGAQAANAFETVRNDYSNATIVGTRDSYEIACN